MKPKGQRSILMMCWVSYMLAYALRVNIAVVIPSLAAERGYSYTSIGLVTSLFFLTYTLGQLVNGYLGDKVSSKLMIISGLMLSAIFNIGFAVYPSLLAAAICWGLNGYAQSMLWAPIMKTMTVWFHGSQLARVAHILSYSMIVGYALSWGSASLLTDWLDWRLSFLLPAAVVLVLSAFLVLLFKSTPAVRLETVLSDTVNAKMDIRSFFRLIRFPGLLLIALSQGWIREGISIWFPTILNDTLHLTSSSPWVVYLLLPMLNLAGILFVRRSTLHYCGSSTKTLLWIFSLLSGVAITMMLLVPRWPWTILAGMAILLPLSYGLTPLLTSVIPFQYAHHQRVALTVGVMDFSIYLGAALSGLISGYIADHYDWSAATYLWMGAAVLGLAASAARYRRNLGEKRHQQTIHPVV